MKINISKSELTAALSVVIKATASRPSVPSLSGILISTDNGKITLFASDLETSIKTTALGIIEEPGIVAVPGRIFSEIIRSLTDSSIVLETSGESLKITSNQSVFEIRTLNNSDFTRFPDVSEMESVEIDSDILGSMVKKVSKAVSKDETRAVLTGILLSIEGAIVKMVATDSYRLALVEKISEGPIAEKFEVLVPGKAFDEVIKMSSSSQMIKITVSQNQIMFSFGETLFVTRRLEGNYPNYKQLLPKEWKIRATATHSELLDSVKRVSLLALNNTAIKLTMSAEEQNLKLTAKSQDVGNAEENIMVKIEGEDCDISFNHGFLLDGLSVIHSDTVIIEAQDSMKPGILRAPEEDFTYLLMPVRSN